MVKHGLSAEEKRLKPLLLEGASRILFSFPQNYWNVLRRSIRSPTGDDDEDAYMMRSFRKPPFDELHLRRYCRGFRDHYTHYCMGKSAAKNDEAESFCADYKEHCPLALKHDQSGFLALPPPLPGDVTSSNLLVIPPKLPSDRLKPIKGSPVAFDLPIGVPPHLSMNDGTPRIHLTPEIIKTCTADCKLPHCTTECKCAKTYPVVHSVCNPPPHGDLVESCNRWYAKCPMFHPVSY
uniref:Alpha-1,6-mannosyl-glycoprotein 6-beta-N-acetylglucosaminyltransferase n=1 Tax=Syphacia muris TaxID=451379 RepID=A0A0N5AHP8_9BILA